MIKIPDNIESLVPYKAGKSIEEVQKEFGLTNLIKLASNENPLGPSPRAVERLTELAEALHTYPNGGLTLQQALAEYYHLKPENIICGNGSESLLGLILRTFPEADDVLLSCAGTFVGYKVQAHISGHYTHNVPLNSQYQFDVEALAAALMPQTKIVYIANPNKSDWNISKAG